MTFHLPLIQAGDISGIQDPLSIAPTQDPLVPVPSTLIFSCHIGPLNSSVLIHSVGALFKFHVKTPKGLPFLSIFHVVTTDTLQRQSGCVSCFKTLNAFLLLAEKSQHVSMAPTTLHSLIWTTF